jgi:hypothetical protein
MFCCAKSLAISARYYIDVVVLSVALHALENRSICLVCPDLLNCVEFIPPSAISACLGRLFNTFYIFAFSVTICLLFHDFASQALSNPQYRGDVLISLLEAFGRSVCYLLPLPPSSSSSPSPYSQSPEGTIITPTHGGGNEGVDDEAASAANLLVRNSVRQYARPMMTRLNELLATQPNEVGATLLTLSKPQPCGYASTYIHIFIIWFIIRIISSHFLLL